MCLTHNHWSSAGASPALRDYGSAQTRPDDFLVRRCETGHKSARLLVVEFSGVQSKRKSTFASFGGPLSAERRRVFGFLRVGLTKEWTAGFRSSNSNKGSFAVRALTEGKDVDVQEQHSLRLRRPPSVQKIEIKIDSRELAAFPTDVAPKSRQYRKTRCRKTTLRIPKEEHSYQAARASFRSSQRCDPKVEEVIAALKLGMDKNGSVEMVMDHYYDISKVDISGILTEFQIRQDWRGALQFFKWMKNQPWYAPNSRQYTKLIGFLGREGKVDLACGYFQEMLLEKCKPDQYTFTAMVNAYGKAKMFNEALDVFSYMKVAQDANCQPTIVTCNALIDTLLKGGKYDLAFKTFADMREQKNGLDVKCKPNVVTYNILIDALCKEGHVTEAVRMLYKMSEGDEDHAIAPNVSTYNTLINACGKTGLYDKAEELLEHMTGNGHEPDRITYTALIDAYGKAGLCESAENMFKGMRSSQIQVDVTAYTAMIDAYAREGHHEKAESLFKIMGEAHIIPNQITYLALMEAYGKSGLPLAAQEVFLFMQRAGWQPTVLHFSALVNAYGKAGLHSEAADVYKMMKKSGTRPNSVTLSAILTSMTKCKTWEDAKVLILCLQWSGCDLERGLYDFLMGAEEQWDPALQMLENVREAKQSRQSLFNALLDVLWYFGMKARAAKVVSLSKRYGIYAEDYYKDEWRLDLHGLSVGGAIVAFLVWLDELQVAWLWGEDVPARVRIVTGKGKHSKTKVSAVRSAVERHLRQLLSPFSNREEEYSGFLVASGESVKAWLSSPGIKKKLQLTE